MQIDSDGYDPEVDALGCWEQYLEECRRQYLAGEPLPDLFLPRLDRTNQTQG